MSKLEQLENRLFNLQLLLERTETGSYERIECEANIKKVRKWIQREQDKISKSYKKFSNRRGSNMTPPKPKAELAIDKHLLSPKKRGKIVFNPAKTGNILDKEVD